MRKVVLLVALLSLGVFLAACGDKVEVVPPPATSPPATTPPAATPPPAVTPPAATVDAKVLYSARCAACHGADRKGKPGLAPSLLPSDHEQHSVAQLAEFIDKGVPGTAMPPFGAQLSEAEINALADLIKNVVP